MKSAIQANPTIPQKASRMATILSLVSGIVINVVLPILIYWVLKTYTSTSDFLSRGFGCALFD